MSQSLATNITEDDRLRQIAQHTPGVIYQARMRPDGSFHFPYASDGLQEVHGTSPAEVSEDASQLFSVIHPEDIDRVTESILESAKSLTPWYCEYRVNLPHERQLWLVGHSTPQREADGSTLWHGYLRDITESKTTEVALKASENKFRGIIENLNDMVYVINADASFDYVSPQFQEVMGYELAELLNNSLAKLVHPEDLSICVDALQQSFQGEKVRGIEYRALHKDGNYYWHSSNVSALRDEDGEVVACLGIARYVHDRKQAEKSLQETNALLNSVLDTMPDFFFAKDLEGRHTVVNSNLAQFFGKSVAEIIGKTDAELLPPEVAEKIIAKDREIMAKGITERFEEVVPIDGVKDSYYLTVKTPLFDAQGNVTGLIGVAQNITDRKAAETALAESEAQNRAILQSIPDIMFRVNESGIYLGYSTSTTLTDLGSHESIGTFMGDCLSPEHYQRHKYHMDIVLETRQNQLYEQEIEIAGRIQYEEVRIVPIEGKEEVLFIIRDISDRKQAEAALAESEAQNWAILQAIPDLIFRVNRDGIYLSYSASSKSTELLDSLSNQQALGKPMMDYLPPENYQLQRHYMEIALATKYIQIYEQEVVIDGQVQQEEVRVVPLEDREEVLFIMRDISDRKQAETQLKEVSERLSLALKSGKIGCWEWNIVQNALVWDDRMYEMYGVNAESHRGLAYDVWTSGLHPDDRDASEQLIQQAVAGQAEFNPEFRVVHPDGSTHFIKAFGLVQHDAEGNPQKMIGVNLDISEQQAALRERKEAEILLQEQTTELETTLKRLQNTQTQLIQAEKMSSLGQLVGGIAHEINNPVSFIYGNIQPATNYVEELIDLVHLYQSHYPDPPQIISKRLEEINLEYLVHDFSRLLESMKNGATRIRDIIKSLRTFSRLDEEGCKAIDLHENIESTLMVLQSRFNGRDGKPEILLVKDYGDLPWVECYGGLLNQVFVNLLMNAIDAIDSIESRAANDAILLRNANAIEQQRNILEPIPDSKYYGEIKIATSLTSTNQVAISIQDNGCGMNAQIQEKIFNPFFTTKAIGQGTGMGLAISYQIMTENHQGNISVNSTPGEGTEFIITLPIKQVLNSAANSL